MDSTLRSVTSFLPPKEHEITVDAIYEMGSTILATLVLIAFLEVASYKTVKELRKTKEGASLHNSGFAATLFNFVFVAIPVHVVARLFVPASEEPRASVWEVVGHIVVFVVLQNIAFYFAHMAMHTKPLYWMHRYHHRYNTYVTPSSANAVTISEFFFAYIIPPALILVMTSPSKLEMNTAMNIISFCNILVHTPCIEEWSERNLPAWWVGTNDHCEHHRRITKNYAAPCLNIDYFLGASPKQKKNT